MAPFLERELKSEYQQRWFDEVKTTLSPQQLTFAGTEKNPKWDIATRSRGDVEPVESSISKDAGAS